MEKTVSIVIPYYKETPADLCVALSSINNQVGVNFNKIEVILVNDGGLPLQDELFFSYFKHLNISSYRYDENHGAGYARRIGTAAASGQYVMYMDADDQLQYVGSLLDFFNVVKDHGDHQVIIGAFLEESNHFGQGYRYHRHNNHDWKSAYAKWFNQDYLRSIKLTWREDLRVFEDTYFVGVACEAATDIYYLDSVVYTWMWHADTTVRKNGGNDFYPHLEQWALSHRASLEKIQQYRPAMLPFDFLNYLSDLYLREQTYSIADPAAYAHEEKKLINEFAQLWPETRFKLRAQVEKMINDQRLKYKGQLQTDKLAEFIARHDRMLQDKRQEQAPA